MTDQNKESYRVLMGLDYPSIKDGKRRIRAVGDIIDDLPKGDIKRLVKEGAIEPADTPAAPAADDEQEGADG